MGSPGGSELVIHPSHTQGATLNVCVHRGRGTGITLASPCWAGKGGLPLEQMTPASFSCPQRLFSQPRELQLASEGSVPVHSTSSSMTGPLPVGTRGSQGPHWRRSWTLGGEQVLQQCCSLAQWGCLKGITKRPQLFGVGGVVIAAHTWPKGSSAQRPSGVLIAQGSADDVGI